MKHETKMSILRLVIATGTICGATLVTIDQRVNGLVAFCAIFAVGLAFEMSDQEKKITKLENKFLKLKIDLMDKNNQ